MQATRRRRRTLLGDRDARARACVCEQLAQGRCCWATRRRPVIFIHQTRAGCRCHVISDIIELRSPNAAGRPLLLEQAVTRNHASNTGWRRVVVVSGVRRMNEVNARRARLVLGWVTVFGRVYHLGM